MKIFYAWIIFGFFSFSFAENVYCVLNINKTVCFEGSFENADIFELMHADKTERKTIEDRIVETLENSGFPAAKIIENELLDTLIISLIKGDGYVFGKSFNAIKGKTDEDVFAKLSLIERGSAFVKNDLLRAERRLERSGYFVKDKSTELYRMENRNILVPLFYMQDASLSYAEGIISYSSEDNEWVGVLDINLKNLAGTAHDLQMEGSTGNSVREISLYYKEPWLLNSAWNGILKVTLEDDSTYTDGNLQIGLERPINFEWTFSILGGVGNDYWISSLNVSYENKDAFLLPRHGTSFGTSLTFKRMRDSSQYTLSLEGYAEHFVPVILNFVSRTALAGGYLYPTNRSFNANELFSLGGVKSWKGYRPDFLKTRAYGNAEFAIRYQGIYRTAFEAFYEPGLYRGRYPEHGFKAVHQYGLGIEQYHDSFSVSIYYALIPSASFMDGLLHLGVKTLF